MKENEKKREKEKEEKNEEEEEEEEDGKEAFVEYQNKMNSPLQNQNFNKQKQP